MDKQIAESTLVTPIFTGSDTDVCVATNCWSSAISTLSGLNNCDGLTQANKVELFHAILHYAKARLNDAAGQSAPVPIAPPYAQPQAAPGAIVVPSQQEQPTAQSDAYYDATMTMPEFEVRNESKAIDHKMIQRMRELAGIPHSQNRV